MLPAVFHTNCSTIIKHLIVLGLFRFSKLRLEVHGGCNQSADDAHSFMAPDPTSIYRAYCLRSSCFVLFLYFPLDF